jgi:hypothetical protein
MIRSWRTGHCVLTVDKTGASYGTENSAVRMLVLLHVHGSDLTWFPMMPR